MGTSAATPGAWNTEDHDLHMIHGPKTMIHYPCDQPMTLSRFSLLPSFATVQVTSKLFHINKTTQAKFDKAKEKFVPRSRVSSCLSYDRIDLDEGPS